VSHLDPRRIAPRIRLDGLCGVVPRDPLPPAPVCHLSAVRPRPARPGGGGVQPGIELPGIDGVGWARAEVAHAFLSPLPGRTAGGQPRFWCRAGLRLAGVAQRERRLLRDFVFETRRARAHADVGLAS